MRGIIPFLVRRAFRSRRCSTTKPKRSRSHSVPLLQQQGLGYADDICCRCLSSIVETSYEYESDHLNDDGQRSEKAAALNHALSQLAMEGDFDRESRLWLPRFFLSRYSQVVSTGSLKLDLALGIGGLPKGRIIEIYGKEASGKTTLALHIIKEAQRHGGYCAYLDVENAIDPSLLDAMGINTEKLLFARPDCAENTLSVANTLAKSGAVDAIVVDSVAALVPQYELENAVDATNVDRQAKLITQALRKIQFSASESQTLIVFVNQVRSNISSSQSHGYISEVTCGGNALKFYAAVRLRTRRSCLLQAKEKISGIRISVEVIKNKLASIMKDKLAPVIKNAGLKIEFGRGVCREAEVLELASDLGFISKEGSGFRIEGKLLESHIEAERYLATNVGVMDKLITSLRMRMFNRT